MQTLLDKRIPIAWFLLVAAACAAILVVWLALDDGRPPSGAVLIVRPTALAVASGPSPSTGPPMQAAAVPVTPTPGTITVYVSGGVNNPGVYRLLAGDRVVNAIDAAGGATNDADTDAINLARRLSDEEQVRVPRKGEPVVIAAAPTAGNTQPTAIALAQTVPGGETTLVNINTATDGELEELPGIGEVLAKRIIADREANGPFGSIEDLMRVPGIKSGIFEQIRKMITVTSR